VFTPNNVVVPVQVSRDPDIEFKSLSDGPNGASEKSLVVKDGSVSFNHKILATDVADWPDIEADWLLMVEYVVDWDIEIL
jgi:hypothetical protein